MIENYHYVLSFASQADEIDLWPFNDALAQEGRLLLPRIVSETKILPYAVSDCSSQLILHHRWEIFEPNPKLCEPFPLEDIDCVIVPAVAFDMYGHRLGYGRGYYDRLLAQLDCPFFGIAFSELLSTQPFPIEAHDIPINHLLLF